MRRIVVGAVSAAGLVIAVLAGTGWTDPGYNIPGPVATGVVLEQEGRGLITHLSGVDGQPLVLTVIDPRAQWIGVYHIDRSSGSLTLKSARKISWDLDLVDYNTGKPLPQEIRSGLPR